MLAKSKDKAALDAAFGFCEAQPILGPGTSPSAFPCCPPAPKVCTDAAGGSHFAMAPALDNVPWRHAGQRGEELTSKRQQLQAEHAEQHHCGGTARGYSCIPRAFSGYREFAKCKLLDSRSSVLAISIFCSALVLKLAIASTSAWCSGKIAEFPFPFPLAQVSNLAALTMY